VSATMLSTFSSSLRRRGEHLTTAKAVTLSNTGNATLTISNIAVSGDFALATVTKTKKITPCVNGGTVAAGASCEVKVTFTPTEAGTRTGDLTFTDNAPNSPQNVALSGTGK
jgi:Abnormal spindle-like microcephaly-assoc'd, ASPM-SPD-2-Hydin